MKLIEAKGKRELKAARGKTIKTMTVFQDFEQQDLEVEFTDGTFLMIGITPKVEVKAEFVAEEKLQAGGSR